MKRVEDPIQKAVVGVFRLLLRGAIIHHSRNEGNRGGIKGIIDGKRGKEMGVCAGYPDTVIHYEGGTFFVETKPAGKYLSKTQKEIRANLEGQGFVYYVAHDALEARAIAKDIKRRIVG